MKKISLVALASVSGMALFAQSQPQLRTEMSRQVRLGVKAGVNLAKMDVDEAPGTSVNNKTSMHGGLLVNIPVGSGGLAVQPEVLYNGYGAKMAQDITIGTTTSTVRYEQDMHYVSLPVMLQWKSAGGFYLETGPQASYLLKATQDNGETDVSNKEAFDKFDFAWAGGLGYMSRIGLGVGARYNYGLSNVIEDGGGDNSANDGYELKNRVISVGLFYNFGAHK